MAAKKKALDRSRAFGSGVADGTRTHDNRNHNPGLYQLSYSHHGDLPRAIRAPRRGDTGERSRELLILSDFRPHPRAIGRPGLGWAGPGAPADRLRPECRHANAIR